MQSWFILRVLSEIMDYQEKGFNDLMLRKAMERSNVLSSDVGAGINPNFKSVHDPLNAARLGYGIVLTKYTGSGGKGGSNDADAEFMAKVRRIWDDNNVDWQIGTLGKVDEGGGGTVAKFLAEYNMNVVDAGPALLSMHSPFELASVMDIYTCYEAYKTFFEKMN
jgi:aspartyl aminopeptidase